MFDRYIALGSHAERITTIFIILLYLCCLRVIIDQTSRYDTLTTSVDPLTSYVYDVMKDPNMCMINSRKLSCYTKSNNNSFLLGSVNYVLVIATI